MFDFEATHDGLYFIIFVYNISIIKICTLYYHLFKSLKASIFVTW